MHSMAARFFSQTGVMSRMVSGFQPHCSVWCGWRPDVFLDIGSVWEKKRRAFECMEAQEHLWEYYTRVALQRGNQAARNSGKKVTYGEAYQRLFPELAERLA